MGSPNSFCATFNSVPSRALSISWPATPASISTHVQAIAIHVEVPRKPTEVLR